MVNMGRPSQGCFTCKERRVKCGVERPSCRRCAASNRKCGGYPAVWELIHRQQNMSAQKHVQSRVERKAAERLEQASATVPRSVHVRAEVYSLNRFYADYTINSGIAIYNLLPGLYGESPEACFQEAMLAVALASSSHQLCQSGLMAQARRHYGRAITQLNIGLSDPVRAGEDSLLMTLCMFGLFENIVAEQSPDKMNPDTNCHQHFRGGLVLLKYRAKRQLFSPLDRTLFMLFTHIAAIDGNVHNSGEPPTAFNGLLALSTETTKAIAKCLFRCVRFHVMEMILDFLASLNASYDDAMMNLPFYPDLCNGAAILEQICEDIRDVFELDGRQYPPGPQPGMAHRAICMFWPLMLVLTSSLTGDDKMLWVIEKLQHIGEVSGFGPVVNAARGISGSNNNRG